MPASLPQKRSNPFREPVPQEEPEVKEVVEEVQVEVEEKPKPKKVAKVVKPVRIKYTATMDSQLRKQLRIAAVNLEIDVSEYIERAVREKLEREGY